MSSMELHNTQRASGQRLSTGHLWVHFALLTVFLCGGADLAAADPDSDPQQATLEIIVSNLESDEGWLAAVLLDSATQFDSPDQFFRADKQIPVHDGTARVVFEDVPYGTYAVKIFHDENKNGDLDTNFVGYPKESFGFSNDAMGKFGPPTFEQAAFEVGAKAVAIQIEAQ